MSRRPLLFFAAILISGATAPSPAPSPLERQVLDEINRARTAPATFAASLVAYRSGFEGLRVIRPGQVTMLTREGVPAVDEAIAAMRSQAPLGPISQAPVLAAAAADHVREQGPSGKTGHRSEDGSGPGERVRKRGGGTYVAEVISYGASTGAEVVRQLIVDDGVPSRGHRKILTDGRYRFAGVACGAHRQYRTMCVVKLSTTASGDFQGGS